SVSLTLERRSFFIIFICVVPFVITICIILTFSGRLIIIFNIDVGRLIKFLFQIIVFNCCMIKRFICFNDMLISLIFFFQLFINLFFFFVFILSLINRFICVNDLLIALIFFIQLFRTRFLFYIFILQ